MEFQQSKYQVIAITTQVKSIIDSYQIHHHILEQVHCAKYLGVYIDSKLPFSTHVDAIMRKVNSIRAFLAKDIARCSKNVKQTANNTYIRSIVECASTVYHPHTNRHINKIKMVQCRCVHHFAGNFYRTSSVSSLLRSIN